MSFIGSLKKTLAVVMSATVLSSVGVMMASAEDASVINLMPADASAVTGTNATATMEDGVLKLVANDGEIISDRFQTVAQASWDVGKSYDIAALKNLYLDLVSTGANWGMTLECRGYANGSTETTDLLISLEGDFALNGGTETAGIASGEYNTFAELYGSPNWNLGWGGAPENSTFYVDKVNVLFRGAATLDLSKLYAAAEEATEIPTDPSTSETEPSTSETEPTTPPTAALVEKSVSLLADAADWNYDSAAMTVTAGENGGLVFANTNGQWPSADYAYDTPITFDPKTAKISYDITVGSATNVNLFFKDSFPGLTDGENNFADDGYVSLSKYVENAQLNGDDLTGVNTQYKGVIDLSQVEFPAGCLNDDGTVTLNGINIFSIGAADASSVVYADLTLTYMAEADVEPTDPTTDDTTASTDSTDTTGSTAADSTAATTGKQNPTTGESTAMIAAGLVLMAASAGAVVLCAKKKAR